MPATSPVIKVETRAAIRPLSVIPAQAGIHLLWPDVDARWRGGDSNGDHGLSDAPEFALLDAGGPRPGSLALSFGLSSALLVLAFVLARPSSVTPPAGAQMVSEIVIAPEPLWLPAHALPRDSHRSATHHSHPDPPAHEPHPLPAADPSAEAAAPVDRPAPVSPKLQPSPEPPPSEVAAPDPKPEQRLVYRPSSNRRCRKPAPHALGSLPLPRLIEDEASLAAGLAALPSDRRLALPSVSIRVDADWLEVLPQTKEELYFSVTTPQADSEVLAYLPATLGFTLKRPLQPLWQIREAEQVPALAALRSAAAGG